MKNKLLPLTLLAIAFAFVESSVVVYLRKIYYGDVMILFPLKTFDKEIFSVELFREASTIIMLMAVPAAVFKKGLLRFAGFLWCFAVWDIFYYVFLKFTIGWPLSIMEWDILFLIPVAWVSPVLAPIICSVTMLILSGIIFYRQETGNEVRVSRWQLGLLITGSLIILISFIQDYAALIIRTTPIELETTIGQYTPQKFNWLLFSIGTGFNLYAAAELIRRTQKDKKAMAHSLPGSP